MPNKDVSISLDLDLESEACKDSDSESIPSQKGPAFCHVPERGMSTSWEKRKPPTQLQALDTLDKIQGLLHLRRKGKQKRYKESKVKRWAEKVLKNIQIFLKFFMNDKSDIKEKWMEASKRTVQGMDKATEHKVHRLHEEAKKIVLIQEPPKSPYGSWNVSKIKENEELRQEISLYLQEKEKYVKYKDIMEEQEGSPDPVEAKKKSISLATVKHWMKKLGY